MVKRIHRVTDCKTEVEASLRAMGYDTNPVDQNNLHNKECVVLYDTVSTAVYTQEEYDHHVYITIDLVVDNNNELPYVMLEIMRNVTYDVEQAVVPWCTSFQFSDSSSTKLGSSHLVHLVAFYEPILDWYEDHT